MADTGLEFMPEQSAQAPVKETPEQIIARIRNQKIPMPKLPVEPPPPPPSTEKWSFRTIRGTREQIRAAIQDARLTDPKTRKPGNEPLPEPVVKYLLWILDNRKGDVFTLDAHVHAGDENEWSEHLHLKRWS
jgi:hypothetical protein